MSPIARLAAWAHTRGWNNLELLSTAGNSYSAHYYGNTAALTPAMRAQLGYKDNENWDEPMLNVFRKDENTILHFWGSEMVFTPEDHAQEHRGMDFAVAAWGPLHTAPAGHVYTLIPNIDYATDNNRG